MYCLLRGHIQYIQRRPINCHNSTSLSIVIYYQTIYIQQNIVKEHNKDIMIHVQLRYMHK